MPLLRLRRPVRAIALRTALAALVLAAPPAAGAATKRTGEPAAAAGRATVRACAQGTDRAAGAAIFEGRMAALPDQGSGGRLQMRFTLEEREPAATRWHRVALPAWVAWRTSAPGVPGYVLDRRVRGLAAPAAYRASIRFRWLGDDGSVLAEARSVSTACRQADTRPDLVVRDLRVLPTRRASRRRYVAVVANAGRGPAGPFSVALRAGRWTGTAGVDGLEPGEAVRVTATGPRCPAGGTATAQADPDGAIDEADEDDNGLTVACPG
jgi:CARDB